jgi:hypothetical protein
MYPCCGSSNKHKRCCGSGLRGCRPIHFESTITPNFGFESKGRTRGVKVEKPIRLFLLTFY